MTIQDRADNHAKRWEKEVLERLPEDVTNGLSFENSDRTVYGHRDEIGYCFIHSSPSSILTFRCRIDISETTISPQALEVYYTCDESNENTTTSNIEINSETMSELTQELLSLEIHK